MGTNFHENALREIHLPVRTHGVRPKYVRDSYWALAKLPIDEDARTVRPYRSSGNSLVYLGTLLFTRIWLTCQLNRE